MPKIVKNEPTLAREILTTFAQYGFRKTSMTDIARSAGVSRQAVYKKFGSKEKCYEWTIRVYLSAMYKRIFAVLDKNTESPKDALLEVFDIFIGEAVGVINNPHGPDVLNDTLKATHSSEEDWPLRYRARLAAFIEKHELVSADRSTGTAFALISAGKGLLLEKETRENFLDDMKVIIESLVGSGI